MLERRTFRINTTYNALDTLFYIYAVPFVHSFLRHLALLLLLVLCKLLVAVVQLLFSVIPFSVPSQTRTYTQLGFYIYATRAHSLPHSPLHTSSAPTSTNIQMRYLFALSLILVVFHWVDDNGFDFCVPYVLKKNRRYVRCTAVYMYVHRTSYTHPFLSSFFLFFPPFEVVCVVIL